MGFCKLVEVLYYFYFLVKYSKFKCWVCLKKGSILLLYRIGGCLKYLDYIRLVILVCL